jgi:FlaA1/EpsC-like NDP-sugar epimerase
MWANWLWELAVKLFALLVFGQITGLLGYFSIPDLQRIGLAMASSSLVIYGTRWFPGQPYGEPRGVLLVDFLLSTAGVCLVRLACRMYRERYNSGLEHENHTRRRVGIVGAGDVGASLARDLMARRGLGMEPVVFFDDEKSKWKSSIYGVPVMGPPEILRRSNLNLRLEEVIIAMPSAPAKRIGEIVKLLQGAHLKFQTVPSIDQLATGKVKVSRLRSVEIQDLLGREPVKLETENIRHLLRDHVVAITGAGGSIGSELCRQVASFNPKLLLLIEQSEVRIFEIEQELIGMGYGGTILPLVADILDEPRMHYIFNRFAPQILFHAAAHRHVPMMESQPGEAIKNNSLGTARLAELALESGLERFVMISTDKAINPTNVMGASKRLAEIYVQALHAANPGRTKFMAVRFGNVL